MSPAMRAETPHSLLISTGEEPSSFDQLGLVWVCPSYPRAQMTVPGKVDPGDITIGWDAYTAIFRNAGATQPISSDYLPCAGDSE